MKNTNTMTTAQANKQYSSVCDMIRAYGKATAQEDIAESIISNPYNVPADLPFFGVAAGQLLEALKGLDKKTTKAGQLNAMKRFLMKAGKGRDIYTGVFEQNGKYHLCDGYRLLSLNEDRESLPHVAPEDKDKIMMNTEKSMKQPREYAHANGVVLNVPALAELKAWKAANVIKRDPDSEAYLLDNCVVVNINFLIDAVQALPGAVFYKPEKWSCPVYFSSEEGEGMILPIRPKEGTEAREIVINAYQNEEERAERKQRAEAAAILKEEAESLQNDSNREKAAKYVKKVESGEYSASEVAREIRNMKAAEEEVERERREKEEALERVASVARAVIDTEPSARNLCGVAYRQFKRGYITEDEAKKMILFPVSVSNVYALALPAHIEEPEKEPEREEKKEEKKEMKENNILEEIRTGDFVEISGSAVKNNNGLFLVTEVYKPGNFWLHKVTKAGKLAESAYSTNSWPLHYYSSNRAKAQEAAKHDKVNCKIEKRENIPSFYAWEYFTKKAEEEEKRAEAQKSRGYAESFWKEEEETAEKYRAIAERIKPDSIPAEEEPETGIKFYYNGFKVDGGKLVKVYYSVEPGLVCVSAKEYGKQLPEKYFMNVKNETDSQSDYFDTDSATITPEHPLYKYIRYAAITAKIKECEKGIKFYEKQLSSCSASIRRYYESELENRKAHLAEYKAELPDNPGNPSEAEINNISVIKEAEEKAAKAKAEAEAEEKRARIIAEQNAGRIYIDDIRKQYPIIEGQPVVLIHWSEHPAFYSFKDDELKLSVMAADTILAHYDLPSEDGYFKTKYTVFYTDEKTGEEKEYTDRYDLGDNNGGLINLIRSYDPAGANGKFAAYLERFTTSGQIVSISVAPWVEKLAEQKAEKERAEAEEIQDSMEEVKFMLEMLNDSQLEHAIYLHPYKDQEKRELGKFFLQELYTRDKERAFRVFKNWQSGNIPEEYNFLSEAL